MSKIAVLAGGRSPEHDVSLQSATQVVRGLDARWEIWPVLLGRDGSWSVAADALGPERRIDDFSSPAMERMSPGAAVDHLVHRAGVDVVFPVLHGPGGEDGAVQGMLELHDLPFVGADCAASATAMDKLRTRECLRFHGIPMPRAYVPAVPVCHADPKEEATAIEQAVGFPCFVKADSSGSSLGVARVDGVGDVANFLEDMRARGGRFVAEALVSGEEVTVAVLGNVDDQLEPLVPVGIYPVRDSYFTYETKYSAALCREIAPPPEWSTRDIADVQALATRCHEALRCDGMSRTDIIVTSAGPVVLEVNTIPGLTEVSLLPRAAAASGLTFSALLDRLIELAMARWPGTGG